MNDQSVMLKYTGGLYAICIHSIHSFNQIELQASCMSDAILSTGNTEMINH